MGKKKLNKKIKQKYLILTLVLFVAGLMFLASSQVLSQKLINQDDLNLYRHESILDDDFSLDPTMDIRIADEQIMILNPDDVDQSLVLCNGQLGIADEPLACHGQSVYNNREPLLGFQVWAGRHGMPDGDLYIGVMKLKYNPTVQSNFHHVGVVHPNDIPEGRAIRFDCELETPMDMVKSGDKYYCFLVFMSDAEWDPDNHWFTPANDLNMYPAGIMFSWNGIAWSQYYQGVDFTFITYTKNGGSPPPPQEPVISITFTNWAVVTDFCCYISWLGAAAAGVKYLGWI